MTAKTAHPRPEPKVSMAELFPQMRFREKLRATGICVLLLIPAVAGLWWVIGPWDPLGAVTIVYHHRPWLALPVLVVFAAAGSALATVLMRGRLTDFGVFAVGVALAGFGLRGGDLTVLLQYEAGVVGARKGLHAWLSLDVLLWTVVFAAGFLGCAVAEAGLRVANERDVPRRAGARPPGLLSRWLERAAARTGTSPDWRTELRHGLLAWVVTVAVATVLIRMTSGRPEGLIRSGQVCFAIGLGFWLGALAANQFCRPALSLWYCLAVPVVALTGHLGAWADPDLPAHLARYADIVTIVPKGLARGLPIDYLTVGPAAAILGIWTSHRVHRAREEAAES